MAEPRRDLDIRLRDRATTERGPFLDEAIAPDVRARAVGGDQVRPPIAARHQKPRDIAPGVAVRKADGQAGGIFGQLPDLDEQRLVSAHQIGDIGADRAAGDDRIDLAAERGADQFAGPLRRHAGQPEHHGEAGRRQFLDHRLDRVVEDRIDQVRDQHRHHLRLARRQPAREQVGDIARRRDRRADALGGGGRDHLGIVDEPADRRARYAGVDRNRVERRGAFVVVGFERFHHGSV